MSSLYSSRQCHERLNVLKRLPVDGVESDATASDPFISTEVLLDSVDWGMPDEGRPTALDRVY